MIADLDDRSYSDMLDLRLVSLQEGAQLKWNPTRLELVEELTKPGRIRKPLNNLTDAMTRKYMALLKVYKTRKRSAQFQQAWLGHIENYFMKPEAADEDVNVKSIWKLVWVSVPSGHVEFNLVDQLNFEQLYYLELQITYLLDYNVIIQVSE